MSVFLDDDLELRPGWRFAAYVIAYIATYVATGAGLSEIISSPVAVGSVEGLALSVVTFLPPAVLAFLFVLRFVDPRPVATFGVTPHEGWSRDLGMGLFVALGMVAVFAVGVSLSAGWAWRTAGQSGASEDAVWITGLLLTVAAANEELVYRGYPLQVLITATGPVPAVLAMSALFGLGHRLNPNATWLGTLNVFLAGVLLSIAYLRTRSLWFPYGIHIGWNVSTGVLLGLPVSGVRLSSFWHADPVGADWLTGGSFGPEGGILATVAIIAAAVFVGTTRSVYIRPALKPGGAGGVRKR